MGNQVDPRLEHSLQVYLGLLLALIATLIVVFLLVTWRRFMSRDWYRRRSQRGKRQVPDAWQASGDRLISAIDQQQRGDDEAADDDEPDKDADEDGEGSDPNSFG